jgi:RNA methyltransferase, TrmH family
MITSRSNPRIKEIRLLKQARHRESRGEYFIEGVRLVEEALAEAGSVRQVLYSPRLGTNPRGERLLAAARRKFQGAQWIEVDEETLASIADTRAPQGILAVLKKKEWTWKDVESREGPVLCFPELQDPGNLGTIFRVAEAGGGGGLILTSGSVDPYSPKVLRASAGSFFRLPFLIGSSPEAVLQELRSRGYRIWAAAASGGSSLWQADLSRPAALLLGQEGGGLPEEWKAQADDTLTVPMAPGIESLNVAMAAGLIVYEAFRRRTLFKDKNPSAPENTEK